MIVTIEKECIYTAQGVKPLARVFINSLHRMGYKIVVMTDNPEETRKTLDIELIMYHKFNELPKTHQFINYNGLIQIVNYPGFSWILAKAFLKDIIMLDAQEFENHFQAFLQIEPTEVI